MSKESTKDAEARTSSDALAADQTDGLTREQIDEWSKRVNPRSLLMPNDPSYVFRDPFASRLRPHQAFVYSLGLEQVLERACESYSSDDPGSETFKRAAYLPDKKHFFSDFDANLSLLKERNAPFYLPQTQCPRCDYKAEGQIGIDQHLTQPHFFLHKLQCNFCEFHTHSAENYKEHVRTEHHRTCKIEKPLTKFACDVCDYEGKCEMNKLIRHRQLYCPYRQVNLKTNRRNPLIDHLQAPSMVDVLDYEYLFNAKPLDRKINNFNQTVYLNSNSVPGGNFFENVRTYEALLQEERPRTSSSLPTSSLASHNSVTRQWLPTPVVSRPRDLSENVVVCFKCSAGFHGEQRMRHLIDHLRFTHMYNDTRSLCGALKENNLMNQSNPFIEVLVCPSCSIVHHGAYKSMHFVEHLKSAHQIRDFGSFVELISGRNRGQSNEIGSNTTPDFVLMPVTVIGNSATKKFQRIDRSEFGWTAPSGSDQPRPSPPPDDSSLVTLDGCKGELAQIKNIFEEAFGQSQFLQNIHESLEQKTFSGKCYLCNYQVILNLKQHLFYRHNLTFTNTAAKNQCLKCGLECLSVKYLVVHYYMAHSLIVLTTLNKAFRINEVLQPRIDLSQANLLPVQPTLSNTLFFHSANKELSTKTDIFYYNNKQMLNMNSYKSKLVIKRKPSTDENFDGFIVRTTNDGDELMEIDLDEPLEPLRRELSSTKASTDNQNHATSTQEKMIISGIHVTKVVPKITAVVPRSPIQDSLNSDEASESSSKEPPSLPSSLSLSESPEASQDPESASGSPELPADLSEPIQISTQSSPTKSSAEAESGGLQVSTPVETDDSFKIKCKLCQATLPDQANLAKHVKSHITPCTVQLKRLKTKVHS